MKKKPIFVILFVKSRCFFIARGVQLDNGWTPRGCNKEGYFALGEFILHILFFFVPFVVMFICPQCIVSSPTGAIIVTCQINGRHLIFFSPNLECHKYILEPLVCPLQEVKSTIDELDKNLGSLEGVCTCEFYAFTYFSFLLDFMFHVHFHSLSFGSQILSLLLWLPV